MYETPMEVEDLQALLNRSYQRAGSHLRSIFSPQLRISAAELVELLKGMQLLSLATVTRACEPRVAPVDGLFFRGRFWFGSSPTSARFAHLRTRVHVSATHTRGESLAVVVHGTATLVGSVAALIDTDDPFWRYGVEVYGEGWRDWGSGAVYVRIDPTAMFASRLPGEGAA